MRTSSVLESDGPAFVPMNEIYLVDFVVDFSAKVAPVLQKSINLKKGYNKIARTFLSKSVLRGQRRAADLTAVRTGQGCVSGAAL